MGGRSLPGRAFSLRHTGGTRVYPYRFYATTPVASFHRINHVGCVLSSLTAMQDWSCTSSHATPSEIERREFCNGIKDTVTKTDVDDQSCICSSLRELNSPGLRRSALDGAATGTLWLYILCSIGLQDILSFPFPKSNVCTCPVDSLHRPASVSSDTIPVPA